MFHNIPYVPRGTTLPSFARAIHDMNCLANFSKTCERIFSNRPSARRLLLGYNPWFCAQVLDVGTFSTAEAILHDHTLWPFFAYTLPDNVRSAWKQTLISRENHPSRRFFSQKKGSQLVKERCHGCAKCVEDDRSVFGPAYWRVDHHLIGIGHCPRHRTPLFADCVQCGAPAPCVRLSPHPTGQCGQCGADLSAHLERKMPMEYWRLLDLVRIVFEGNWQILTPAFRSSFFCGHLNSLQQWPPTDYFASQICDRIVSNFGASSSDFVSETFSVGFSREAVLGTLRGTHMFTEPILYLLVMQHIAHMRHLPSALETFSRDWSAAAFTDTERHRYTPSWEPASLQPFALPECKHAELAIALAKCGLPVNFANELAMGVGTWKTICRPRFGQDRSSRVYDLLPWFHAYTTTVRTKGRERTGPRSPATNKAACRKAFEDQKKRCRTVCLSFINGTDAPTRTKFKEAHQHAWYWLHVNDQRWLNTHLPRLRNRERAVTFPGTVEDTRRRVLRLLARYPEATRTQLRQHAPNAFSWSRAHDFDWLESVLPQPLYRGPR